jgi:hypothetical protein
MAGCVKTEKAALAGPPSPVVSTAAITAKIDKWVNDKWVNDK